MELEIMVTSIKNFSYHNVALLPTMLPHCQNSKVLFFKKHILVTTITCVTTGTI